MSCGKFSIVVSKNLFTEDSQVLGSRGDSMISSNNHAGDYVLSLASRPQHSDV